jgi:Flp pilus assembly protein TadD
MDAAPDWLAAERRYRLAEEAIAANDFKSAARLLAELTHEFPTEPLFHWRLGYARLDAGHPQPASKSFRRAIELDPTCAAAWGGLGQAYMASGDLDQAEMAIRRRIELKPGPNYFVFLSDVLCRKKEIAAAVSACLDAIRLDPNFDEAWYNLGVYYQMLGHEVQAKEAYDKAIALDPRYLRLLQST